MRRRAAEGDLPVGRPLVAHGRLKDIEIEFFNAGAVLFGVKEYVPALMELYRALSRAKLNFQHNLTPIDGPAKSLVHAQGRGRHEGDRRKPVRHDPRRARRSWRRTSCGVSPLAEPPAGSMSIRHAAPSAIRRTSTGSATSATRPTPRPPPLRASRRRSSPTTCSRTWARSRSRCDL